MTDTKHFPMNCSMICCMRNYKKPFSLTFKQVAKQNVCVDVYICVCMCRFFVRYNRLGIIMRLQVSLFIHRWIWFLVVEAILILNCFFMNFKN